MKKEYGKTKSIFLRKDQADTLRAISSVTGYSMNDCLVRILREYIKEEGKNGKD